MQSSLTFGGWSILFVSMVVLAAMPSVSVLTVTARAAASGFRHGAAAAAGVVAGDLVFIAVAIVGLALLAEALGGLFAVIRLAGAAYLVWLGVGLLVEETGEPRARAVSQDSLLSSFTAGLLVTLGDQKAVLFYLGFLPAFIDLSGPAPFDIAIVLLTTLVAVGGIKLVYARFAGRAHAIGSARLTRTINALAGCTMIAVAAFIVVQT